MPLARPRQSTSVGARSRHSFSGLRGRATRTGATCHATLIATLCLIAGPSWRMCLLWPPYSLPSPMHPKRHSPRPPHIATDATTTVAAVDAAHPAPQDRLHKLRFAPSASPATVVLPPPHPPPSESIADAASSRRPCRGRFADASVATFAPPLLCSRCSVCISRCVSCVGGFGHPHTLGLYSIDCNVPPRCE